MLRKKDFLGYCSLIKLSIRLFFLFAILLNCQTKTTNHCKEYKLISEGDGILIEKFDRLIMDENKYNCNNLIFKVGFKFRYSFKHLTKDKELQFFKIINNNSGWEFIDGSIPDSLTINYVDIEVANGNPLSKHLKDYNQTNITYRLKGVNGYSRSGVIENEANVWLHPPREHYFQILELNPFPFIKFPKGIGKEWNWNLEIGDYWSDERWKSWNGQINNKYVYKIINITNLDTNFGTLECYVVDSKASSRIGTTRLKAYFNDKYGFVKLDYTNIDGSKTILDLIEFSEN